MNKVILKINGMTCSACSSSLEKYLNKQKGVMDATVNLVLSQASIQYDDISIDDLNKYIKEAGFQSLGIYNPLDDKDSNNKEKIKLILAGILVFIIMCIAMLHIIKSPIYYSLILFLLSIIFIIYGKDIIINGIKNLIKRIPNMDTLVSIGVISSFIYSTYSMILILLGHNEYVENIYFESCSTIIFFIKFGRYIDVKNKEKTTGAIKELVQITPNKAILEDGTEVSIDEIQKNDILIARPGNKIAVDGTIINGSTHIDEAFLTGESIPSKKNVNDIVRAGSINIDGVIKYRADKVGRESTISEIVHLVVEASNTKTRVSRLVDKISSIFVPIIMLVAFITLICYLILTKDLSISITSFVTVLVVACPCALGLATPLAIVVSVGRSATSGILIKSSEILESAKDIDTICFDKTGTLTYGKLKVSDVYNYSNYTNDELLTMVASLESNSTHPISSAFKEYSTNIVDMFKNIEGVGLYGELDKHKVYIGNNKLLSMLNIDCDISDENKLSSTGSSIMYVIIDNEVVGLIGVKDIIRDNAFDTINKLKKLGKEVIMLTGDNEITANIIAKEVGIDNVIADVLPKDKSSKIKELMKSKKVMMIGDGINDAPSLSQANIGVSISGSTDIALDSSDVILIHDNLLDIVNLINISNKTISIIKQNLFWAFFYNICMIPVAVGILKPIGIVLTPMIASMAMVFSSLTVMLNTLRLRKIRLEKSK